MKKKILLIVLTIVAATALIACTNKDDNAGDKNDNKVESSKVELNSSADALNKVFDTYKEDEKFPMMGGDAENVTDGKAGIFNLSDAEAATATLHISADLIAQVDEAASAVHMMMANNFTAGAFHVKDAAATATFALDLRDSIKSTQWICGFPEKLVMYTVNDEYVVYAVGAADLMDHFADKLETVYGDSATSVTNENME